MYEDGAGRKVQRLNKLVAFVSSCGDKGISRDYLSVWTERNIGLKPQRLQAYLHLLCTTRELKMVGNRVYSYEKAPLP